MPRTESVRNLVRAYPHLLDAQVPLPVINLSERGQRVEVDPQHAYANGLAEGETFEVRDIRGDGDNAFVRLADNKGRLLPRWHRVTELLPARSMPDHDTPRVVEDDQEVHMSEATIQAAMRFEKHVMHLKASGLDDRASFTRAARTDADGAEAYRLRGVSIDSAPEPKPVISLSAKVGESFDQLAERYASEKKISLADAIHQVGMLRPDLAARR